MVASASAPVQYFTLDAELEDGNVVVQWTTISETANLQFFVERWVDADNWEILGTVNGQGNSSTLIEYSFVDENPAEGTSHYRIKQMDYSGSHSYSQVLEVNPYQLWLDDANFFPNPISDLLNISLKGAENRNMQVVVMNSIGEIIKTESFSSTYTMQVDLDELPKGYYYVQLSSDEGMISRRILKM
jgi:hypothetical protein